MTLIQKKRKIRKIQINRFFKKLNLYYNNENILSKFKYFKLKTQLSFLLIDYLKIKNFVLNYFQNMLNYFLT
jgi:hypothetical protein